MEAALTELLPRVLRGLGFTIHAHQCKDDLLKRLPGQLRGYAAWLPEDWRIVVIVDRDADDCVDLKQMLDDLVASAGLRHKSSSIAGQWQVANRLAIEELEAWYFGDWDAVRAAYPRVSPTTANQSRYRDPDAIAGGTWEALERILKRAGYFRTGLRKVEASRAIAAYWEPSRNSSRSFQKLMDCLNELTSPVLPMQGI
jgi:hypothetical protein